MWGSCEISLQQLEWSWNLSESGNFQQPHIHHPTEKKIRPVCWSPCPSGDVLTRACIMNKNTSIPTKWRKFCGQTSLLKGLDFKGGLKVSSLLLVVPLRWQLGSTSRNSILSTYNLELHNYTSLLAKCATQIDLCGVHLCGTYNLDFTQFLLYK